MRPTILNEVPIDPLAGRATPVPMNRTAKVFGQSRSRWRKEQLRRAYSFSLSPAESALLDAIGLKAERSRSGLLQDWIAAVAEQEGIAQPPVAGAP